jgi:hypothetical protein
MSERERENETRKNDTRKEREREREREKQGKMIERGREYNKEKCNMIKKIAKLIF